MSTKPVTVSLHYTVFRIVVKKYGAYDNRAAPLRRSAASRSVGERSDPNPSSGSGSGLRSGEFETLVSWIAESVKVNLLSQTGRTAIQEMNGDPRDERLERQYTFKKDVSLESRLTELPMMTLVSWIAKIGNPTIMTVYKSIIPP